MNVLDLSCFQKVASGERQSMADIVAAYRLVLENISYVDFLLGSESDEGKIDLFKKVKLHLEQDNEFLERSMLGQVQHRAETIAKDEAAKEKALDDEEFKAIGSPRSKLNNKINSAKQKRTAK